MRHGIDLTTFLSCLPDTEERAARRALEDATRRLGRDELRVLAGIAQRLAYGAAAYGPLRVHDDPRNFRREAREEVEDALVYLACAYLRDEAAR